MLVGNPKDSADVVNFVRAVKRGQRKTIGMTKKETDLFVHGTPSENFSKNECISVHQKLKKEAEEAAAADSDDGMDMDDMMAEIREEVSNICFLFFFFFFFFFFCFFFSLFFLYIY